jgi:hypothetical protein
VRAWSQRTRLLPAAGGLSTGWIVTRPVHLCTSSLYVPDGSRADCVPVPSRAGLMSSRYVRPAR